MQNIYQSMFDFVHKSIFDHYKYFVFMKSAETIVRELMLANDLFSQWLGIDIESLQAGNVVLTMKVRPEMTNGFKIAHGGIAFALADSALAFAANGHGIKCVSVETSISHTKMIKSGDILRASASEINISKRFGIYQVTVVNQNKVTVAIFKGTVYRMEEEW